MSGTTNTALFSQSYNSLGQRRHLLRGALTVGTENGDTVNCATGMMNASCYSYDALGRLTLLGIDLSGTAHDASWTFEAYNPASQIEVWDASSALYDYKELTGYQRNNAYNGLNQDTAIAAISGGYDASGNLTNDGDRTFTYDAENRLLTATWPSADRKIELKYDPLGRAYTRIITVISTGSVTTDYWLYDGVNLIDEYTSGGNQRRRYVHGTGTDEPLVWFEGSTNVTTPNLLFANHQGSIVAYANYSGVKQAIYTYGPWGEPTDEVGNANWTGPRFRYTGQVALPEVRLYYYKARVYDPVMGRFLQTDPIGSKDDLNLYAYTAGDPVNHVDPTGTELDMYYFQDSGIVIAHDVQTGEWAFAKAMSSGVPGLSINDKSGPIPPGRYDILEGRDDNHYRLEAHDDHYGDDTTNGNRTRLRLHPSGTQTLGCITCLADHAGPHIGEMLKATTTSTETVQSQQKIPLIGVRMSILTELVVKYGTMTVVSTGPFEYNEETRVLTYNRPADASHPSPWKQQCTLKPNGACVPE